MIVIGLTGGVGMGKSTVDRLLRERGLPVVDTDVLAREVVEPGQPALAEIQRVFGAEVLAEDGGLNRAELARRVFGDADARKQLEEILHPRIRALWRAKVDAWRLDGRPLAVVVIPLLFETHAQTELDRTICVACSAPSQRERLLTRGWTAGQIAQRIASQWTIDKKMTCADYVVWAEGGMDLLPPQVDRILSAAASGRRGRTAR
jgi:dephospho-CoA kinase